MKVLLNVVVENIENDINRQIIVDDNLRLSNFCEMLILSFNGEYLQFYEFLTDDNSYSPVNLKDSLPVDNIILKDLKLKKGQEFDLEYNVDKLYIFNITVDRIYDDESDNSFFKVMSGKGFGIYDKLESYELDLAIIDGPLLDTRFSSMMLDTDYLVCVMSPSNPFARNSVISLTDLKKQKLILRTVSSGTRTLFESTLESNNESISSFDVILEVDNIATIKDLIRKDMGVSILPRSACLDELKKGKVVALPIENFSMVRETRIVYNKDFSEKEFLNEIIKVYGEEA